MLDLVQMLAGRTHRDLELIARAHKLDFTRRKSKASGLASLTQALLQDGAYQQALKRLTPGQLAALQALDLAGGWLPLPLFTHYFGEMRPYKPWRLGSPLHNDNGAGQRGEVRHPWRYPASDAERLYHLGFVFIRDGEMVGLVAEAQAILPPPDAPQAEAATQEASSAIILPVGRAAHGRDGLLRDVAALLGVLLRVDAAAVHGRWLSLSVLCEVNAALLVPDDLSAARSELQTGRLRWLHYLAQVSGLLSVQGGVYKPTAAAWRWLAAPPDVQWSCLMQAVERDLEQVRAPRLWDTFRLPSVQARTWSVVRHTLDSLESSAVYKVKDVLAALKPYLLPDTRANIAYLLRDAFAWSGVLLLSRGRVYVHWQVNDAIPLNPPACDVYAHLPKGEGQEAADSALRLDLPLTASAALVTLLSFATVQANQVVINAEAMRQAVKQGLSDTEVIATLNSLRSEPLSAAAQQQISAWVQAAQRLTLKPVLVLSSPDAETIEQVRSDWRLAGHFAERLSARHLAVYAEDADKLLSRLQRRDIDVTSFVAAQHPRRITDEINSDMADYLLLAVRAYQKLHSRLNASVRIPKALTAWLSDLANDPAAMEASADELVSAVQKQVAPIGYDSGVQDAASIRRWLTLAWRRQQPVTIDYFSPYYDGQTTRTIRIQEIEDDGDVVYIYAHCERAGRDLTFRLDRVQRVHDLLAPDVAV